MPKWHIKIRKLAPQTTQKMLFLIVRMIPPFHTPPIIQNLICKPLPIRARDCNDARDASNCN